MLCFFKARVHPALWKQSDHQCVKNSMSLSTFSNIKAAETRKTRSSTLSNHLLDGNFDVCWFYQLNSDDAPSSFTSPIFCCPILGSCTFQFFRVLPSVPHMSDLSQSCFFPNRHELYIPDHKPTINLPSHFSLPWRPSSTVPLTTSNYAVAPIRYPNMLLWTDLAELKTEFS